MASLIDAVPTDPAVYNCWRDIQVRFRDLDAMGHVNNAVFFTYLELGREAYIQSIDYPDPGGGGVDMVDRFPFILAEIACRFLRPVQIEDQPRVGIRVERFGTKSWDFSYVLLPRAEAGVQAPFGVGRSTQVYFDYRAGRSVAVPGWLVKAVERFEGRSLRDGG